MLRVGWLETSWGRGMRGYRSIGNGRLADGQARLNCWAVDLIDDAEAHWELHRKPSLATILGSEHGPLGI